MYLYSVRVIYIVIAISYKGCTTLYIVVPDIIDNFKKMSLTEDLYICVLYYISIIVNAGYLLRQ